jgi:hypothetical protein
MTDLEVMRERLQAQRAAGIPFAQAWPRAIADMPRTWAATLAETREAWELAYGGRGSHALIDVQELRRAADEADGPQMRARMRLVA